MNITFDPEKRAKTLQERGLDFAEADRVFAEINHTIDDNRFTYSEPRFIRFGKLRGEHGCDCLDADSRRSPDHIDEESQ